MWYEWASTAALVLLALASEGATCPYAEGLPSEAPHTTSERVLSSCPHIMKRLVTPQQISGSWYAWEVLRHGTPLTEDAPCSRYVFGAEDGRLSARVEHLQGGSVIASADFSYTQNSHGLWEAVGQFVTYGYQLGFASDDDSLLLLCSTSIISRSQEPWEDVELSMVLGRQPTPDEAAVRAAENATALEAAHRVDGVVRLCPRLQDCASPAPAH